MSNPYKKEATKIYRMLADSGAHHCPHFILNRKRSTEKIGCCGRSHSFTYFPICTLADDQCPGLEACSRLDSETKAELIRLWESDGKKIKNLYSKIRETK